MLRDDGLSIRAIARQMGLGAGTVARTLAARSKSIQGEKDRSSIEQQGLSEPEMGVPDA